MNTRGWILLLAALGLTTGILLQSLLPNTPQPLIGFTLPDIEGKPQASSQWQGKVLVINFWASWCSPCLEEIPEFIAMQKRYESQGVQFIGIAIDQLESVKTFLNSLKINYPILIAKDTGLNLARQLGNSFDAVPYTLVVDRQGLIVFTKFGAVSKEQLEAVVVPLVK